MAQRWKSGDPIQLLFVCTHNSRRSQIAQAIAPFLFRRMAIEMSESADRNRSSESYARASLQSFSGGTEATMVHPNTVAALLRAGFSNATRQDTESSVTERLLDPDGEPIQLFSKIIQDSANPTHGFAAVMVCSSADAGCPVVAGADARISLPFEDPGQMDNTPEADATYDGAVASIAGDLAAIFSIFRAMVGFPDRGA